MTNERKNQLYEAMIAWICEHITNDVDLFLTLHGEFKMTKEEMHDHCIESLDYLFDDAAVEGYTDMISESDGENGLEP